MRRARTTQNQRIGNETRRCRRGDCKRGKPSGIDGLKGGKRKPIKVTNIYTALNNTEPLNNKSDHIMMKLTLHKDKERITTNALVDSGATEDFIDRKFCIQHQLPVRKLTQTRDIYVIDLVFITGPPGPHKTQASREIPCPGPLTDLGWGGFCPFPHPDPRPRPHPSHAATPGQSPAPAMPQTGPCKSLVVKNGGLFRE